MCVKNALRALIPLLMLAAPVALSKEDEGEDATMETIWHIGEPDRSTAGFALAPGGYRAFEEDPFFGIGISEPARHWPYVHPGTWDYWAGAAPHAFTVLFGLKLDREGGTCLLTVDLADTHDRAPPLLEFRINGRLLEKRHTPEGGGDDSLMGRFEKSRPHTIRLQVPVDLLESGDNQLEILNSWGSWVLYDALRFDAPEGVQLADIQGRTIIRSVEVPPALVRGESGLLQPVKVHIVHLSDPVEAELILTGADPETLSLKRGLQGVELLSPEVHMTTPATIALRAGERLLAEANAVLKPVRRFEIHLLHFSHLDIGYTHTQHEVERVQMEFLDRAQELIKRTDDYPEDARFRWLPECLWAVESYLEAADETKRRAFIERVKAGRIELCALYGNALTGLYSGEELFRLLDYAFELRRRYGISIDTAMFTDVPGATWGLVPVLAQCGIRYFSMSPNPSHRVGLTHVWDDRPFYWVSPSGAERVLCWMTMGYGWFRSGLKYEDMIERYSRNKILRHLEDLESRSYPYDLVQLRYDIGSDNGPPDPNLPDTVRRWNERYAYPRLMISTPGAVFKEFEARYGEWLPVVQGDFTPYWEDGAASTAKDTAVNREAVETLLQAQALWALNECQGYPVDRFYQAWRNAVLYDEHTWGAHNSISEPDSDFAREQAEIKQAFALKARAMAGRLLEEALPGRRASSEQVKAVEVFNTHTWPRTDLVVLPPDLDLQGGRIRGPDGNLVPSQRLSTGELAFMAAEVPPGGSIVFSVEEGEAPPAGQASGGSTGIANGLLAVRLDEKTGAIKDIRAPGIEANLVDGKSGRALNDYIYVAGRDRKKQEYASLTGIKVLDHGPLVATVQAAFDAPGARSLVSEIRLVDGLNRLDICNVIDKLPVREKEGVHFSFPFSVPDGEVRMDMPWAVVRPEKDQVEGACKNFFTVQRWIDVSNLDFGVTWATLDAPLVQMGDIRTDVGGSNDPGDAWLEHIERSQVLYSYVMNNYWETNYKADQEGRMLFRYSIRPHAGRYDQAEAARFAVERCQPLIAVPVPAAEPKVMASRIRIEPPGVMATSIKPSRDGKAWMIRLYAVSGKPERARVLFPGGAGRILHASGPDEARGARMEGPIPLPAYGIATVRAEK